MGDVGSETNCLGIRPTRERSRWPAILAYQGLRCFPGCRIFSVGTRTVLGKPGKLVTLEPIWPQLEGVTRACSRAEFKSPILSARQRSELCLKGRRCEDNLRILLLLPYPLVGCFNDKAISYFVGYRLFLKVQWTVPR